MLPSKICRASRACQPQMASADAVSSKLPRRDRVLSPSVTRRGSHPSSKSLIEWLTESLIRYCAPGVKERLKDEAHRDTRNSVQRYKIGDGDKLPGDGHDIH
jgi:hypothetical protein